jgi:uroporphyrinogen-III decarboxylase
LFDDPGEVEATMDVMTEAACRWYHAAVASSCEVIRCTEDLDTKLVSPDWFRRYAVPALAEYARICHRAGKTFIIHMCGPIKDFLEDIRSTGADAIHCLTAPPMGNTTVLDARRVLAGHMAVMLRPDANLLLRGSADEIARAVAEIHAELGDWRNALIIVPCGRASVAALRHVVRQARQH